MNDNEGGLVRSIGVSKGMTSVTNEFIVEKLREGLGVGVNSTR